MNEEDLPLQEEPNEPDSITRMQLFGTVVLDGLFLIAWAIVQFLVNLVIQSVSLDSVSDRIVFYVLQGLFGASTLLVVLTFIVHDIGIIVIRAYKSLRREKER